MARHLSQVSPTAVSPVVFNFTTSEPVFGVSASLFSTASSTATVGAVSVTATGSFSYFVSVPATGSGVVTLSVATPVGVTDAAGNLLAASGLTASCVFDIGRPAIVRVALAKTQASLSKVSPFVFNVSVSEPCVGVSASMFNTTGSTATVSGALVVAAQGSLVFLVSVPVSTSGSVILRVSPALGGVADLAGNAILPSSLWAAATFGANTLLLSRVFVLLIVACLQTTSLPRWCA